MTTLDSDPRLAKLETHFEYIRRDLDEIKAVLPAVATKEDVARCVTRDELGRAMADQRAELLKWMFAQTVAIITIVVALIKLLP